MASGSLHRRQGASGLAVGEAAGGGGRRARGWRAVAFIIGLSLRFYSFTSYFSNRVSGDVRDVDAPTQIYAYVVFKEKIIF